MAVSAVRKETAKPEAAESEPASAPKKKGFKWKLPLIALLVIGAAGGGAYYWYSIRNHEGAAVEARAEPEKPPQFMPLDPFTVNLMLEDNPQFLQVGLTLKVSDPHAIDEIKLRMPEVRDKILMLLSGQKASTLLTLEGKRSLAAEIVTSVNGIVAPGSVKPATTAKAKTDPEQAQETDAAAGADAEEDADAKSATAGKDAKQAPVLSVLFTSFIIQ